MKDNQQHSTEMTPRENFLMSILNKVINEYKTLLTQTKRTKPFKIVEIIYASSIPGDSIFLIQITNKNCIIQLTAAEIISIGYELNDFPTFHAEIIRQAAQGKLIQFLKLSEPEPIYKIASKKMNRDTQQYIFTIETKEKVQFTRTAEELSKDKNLLANLNIYDIYDVGYTQGTESILKEKTMLLLAKHK